MAVAEPWARKYEPFQRLLASLPFSTLSLPQLTGPWNHTEGFRQIFDLRPNRELISGRFVCCLLKSKGLRHNLRERSVMTLNLSKVKPFNSQVQPLQSPFNLYKPVVMIVEDRVDTAPLMRQVLKLNGYCVIDTDNGRDAAKWARHSPPDLLLVDLNVPLMYELIAARQIIRQAKLGLVPVVVIADEDAVDPYPMMEVGVRRNEYVTRLSDYKQLEHLLTYLLPPGAVLAQY